MVTESYIRTSSNSSFVEQTATERLSHHLIRLNRADTGTMGQWVSGSNGSTNLGRSHGSPTHWSLSLYYRVCNWIVGAETLTVLQLLPI